MAKGRKSCSPGGRLPISPWIYINDPSEDGQYTRELANILPNVNHVQLTESLKPASAALTTITKQACRDKVIVVEGSSFNSDPSVCMNDVRLLQQSAIKHGCNFASINLLAKTDGPNQCSTTKSWGTNHFAQRVDSNPDVTAAKATAEKIYKWLFNVLSVLETLHLIPDEQLREADPGPSYKSYEYCAISDSYKQPKDKRIYFVALVLSKPVVGPNKRLSWQVADKSGTATFFFQHRGTTSDYTWNWVLALKPGDRKCLPRMPSVLIKERPIKTIVKSPFRLTGLAIRGTGLLIKGVGSGLAKVGSHIKLGNRAEWVPELDVSTDAKGRKVKKLVADDGLIHHETATAKTEIKIFTEKGDKTWEDDDSIASTRAGSLVNEKLATVD